MDDSSYPDGPSSAGSVHTPTAAGGSGSGGGGGGGSTSHDGAESKILVAVRVRPLVPREVEAGHARIVKVVGDRLVLLSDRKKCEAASLRSRKPREKRYVFDSAFAPDASQETIYNGTTAFLIDSVVEGFNATVFAYGATGSGKTYTMTGTEDEPGIMFLTLRDLFLRTSQLINQGFQYKVTLSYLEIYNENIRDLTKPGPHLELREHPTIGMRVHGIQEYDVKNVEEIMELLLLGNENRTTEPTEANAESSRSHAVLQILMEQHDASTNHVRTAKLNLIDLAGSERGAVTHNRGLRLLEGANINRSLLALGNCINALSEKKHASFVPFRDSKLTRLLKDSLSGNCNTVMITTVSPSHTAFEESSNSLKYASRAKRIKNYVSCNEKTVHYHVSKYEKLIVDLQQQVALLRSQLHTKETEAAAPIGASAEDRKAFNTLRGEVARNFDEQVLARKQTADIRELQLSHFLSISNMQARADEARMRGAASSAQQTEVDDAVDSVARKIRRNEKLRHALGLRIQELEGVGHNLWRQVGAMQNADLRALLMQEHTSRTLELDNLELESRKLIQDQLAENKDSQLRRLQLHIQLRDEVIHHQKAMIERSGEGAESLHESYKVLAVLEESSRLSSQPHDDAIVMMPAAAADDDDGQRQTDAQLPDIMSTVAPATRLSRNPGRPQQQQQQQQRQPLPSLRQPPRQQSLALLSSNLQTKNAHRTRAHIPALPKIPIGAPKGRVVAASAASAPVCGQRTHHPRRANGCTTQPHGKQSSHIHFAPDDIPQVWPVTHPPLPSTPTSTPPQTTLLRKKKSKHPPRHMYVADV